MTETDDRAGPDVERAPVEEGPRRSRAQTIAGVALVLIGGLWLLERLDAVDLTVTTVLSVATILIGLSVIAMSARGAHGGLIVFGVGVALVATLAAMAPLEGFQGGVGERRIDVSDPADLAGEYNLALGDLTIDLRELSDLGEVYSIKASVGMGQLVIRVPEGVPVSVTASTAAGELQVLDRNANGLGVDLGYESDSFDSATEALRIEAAVFMGRVEVSNG